MIRIVVDGNGWELVQGGSSRPTQRGSAAPTGAPSSGHPEACIYAAVCFLPLAKVAEMAARDPRALGAAVVDY